MTSATITNSAAAPGPRAAATARVKTFLITGGATSGVNLTRHLLTHGHKVVSLDIADFAYRSSQITEIEGDIRDKSIVDQAVAGIG